ncbi:hypothetical protein E2K80_03260 [Rhodophyticola sp. CCM32]|uniref:LysR substrate-binding domain-containing protein n=1 Tax=Rhodophyticola sp. CCM32 TaxID=2916397 RepID=UPI00107F09A8|nr:LysR substrate-binding domain-containing protein [Rhodophyticola sp. CCM32]QBX99870.1 hypothetical protein E2K80_03260 [Rhodophyticola sp. CCM32]
MGRSRCRHSLRSWWLFERATTSAFCDGAKPVCSPELLSREPSLTSPADLAHHTLLHVDWKETEGSWRTWLLAAGAKDVDPFSGPRFTKEEMAVRAALNGEGIALIGDRMAADHIASGRLVCPFSADLSTQLVFAYFLLLPPDRLNEPKIANFREWLISETKEGEAYESTMV